MTIPIPLRLTFLIIFLTNNLYSQLSEADRLIIYAEEYLGKTYKWGGCGSSGDGIDCSCFTRLVFKEVLGVKLHRNSYNQSHYCKRKITSISELQKGDLVFFDVDGKKVDNKHPNGVDHVAIVAGKENGRVKIIHSSVNTNGVSYSYLDDKLRSKNKTYSNVFTGGCRFLRTVEKNEDRGTPGRFPFASKRYLTYADIVKLSKDEIAIMRNEIFARYGYSFSKPKFKLYFSKQQWYTNRAAKPILNTIEKYNVAFLKAYETNGFSPPGNFPQTALRKLTQSELKNLTTKDLGLMRNEIFARYGRVFKRSEYKNYFNGQRWYKKIPKRTNFEFLNLSEIEARNVYIILATEKGRARDKSTFIDDIFKER